MVSGLKPRVRKGYAGRPGGLEQLAELRVEGIGIGIRVVAFVAGPGSGLGGTGDSPNTAAPLDAAHELSAASSPSRRAEVNTGLRARR
jgi:hypothetical protein